MKKIILLLAICLTGFAYSQSSEMTLVVKTIEILEERGTQSPFIDYVDENGEDQRFWFTLPVVGTDEYAEIMIGNALLIKVENTFQYEDGPTIIEGYEFHEDVAKSLVGKKIRIEYSSVDQTTYLYFIEIIN